MLPRPMASFFLEIVERLTAKKDSLREEEEDWDFLFLRFIIRARLLALLDRFKEAAGEFRTGIACFEAKPPGSRRSRALASAYNRLGILCVYMSRFTGDYDFTRWFERGYRYYLENPEPVQEQICQLNISSYAIQVGSSSGTEAIDTYINACAAIVQYTLVSLGGYFFGGDTLARAELAFYRGDLNKAEQFARQAIYQSREKSQYEVETRALSYLMRISVHRGDIAGLREIERQIEALLERDEYINRYVIHDLIMGRFYSRFGLTEKVAPWIKKEREEGDLNVLFRGFDTLIKVRCLFAEKEYAAALRALEREKVKGEVGTFLLGFLETTVMEAAIRHRLGDSEGAFAALKNAYDAARPNGLYMPFIELGEHMYSLTGALLKAHPDGLGISPEWLQTIRRNASAHAKKRALVKAQYSGRETPAPVDFSQHELAILNSLSQGYTSKEIAGDMRISVKMIKSAIRSLYVKLGAANRADAIRVATERGLLQVHE
jgi:DNA-binding CsgD family transcriptional regulator